MRSTLTFGRLPAASWLLALAQAINLTCAVLLVTVAALAGSTLADQPTVATLPYGAQFAAVMALTYPASMAMRRWGRRPVFLGGSWILVLSGLAGFAALERGSFAGLVIAHGLAGAYFACANFYRFAAVDPLPPALRPTAMSLVVAGGVLAALVAPPLASGLREAHGQAPYAPVYGMLAVLGLLNLLVLRAWPEAPATTPVAPPDPAGTSTQAASSMSRPPTPPAGSVPAVRATDWRTPALVAMGSAAGGYAVMNLLMVQSSLVMKDLCSFTESAQAIQAHVLAMFAPAFLTGHLITRWGTRPVLVMGFMLLAAASLCGVFPLAYGHVFAGLVLLGLGWNFTYVGGGALLAERVSGAQRHRWQGLHDTAIAACATIGALLPAAALQWLGWRGSNAVALVLCGLGIVICLSALAPRRQVSPGEAVPDTGIDATRATGTSSAGAP